MLTHASQATPERPHHQPQTDQSDPRALLLNKETLQDLEARDPESVKGGMTGTQCSRCASGC